MDKKKDVAITRGHFGTGWSQAETDTPKPEQEEEKTSEHDDWQALNNVQDALEATEQMVTKTSQIIGDNITLVRGVLEKIATCKVLLKELEEMKRVLTERTAERKSKNLSTTTLKIDAPDYVDQNPEQGYGNQDDVSTDELRKRAIILTNLPPASSTNAVAAYVNYFKQRFNKVDPEFKFTYIDEKAIWLCETSVCDVVLGEAIAKKKKDAKKESSIQALRTLAGAPDLLYTLMDLAEDEGAKLDVNHSELNTDSILADLAKKEQEQKEELEKNSKLMDGIISGLELPIDQLKDTFNYLNDVNSSLQAVEEKEEKFSASEKPKTSYPAMAIENKQKPTTEIKEKQKKQTSLAASYTDSTNPSQGPQNYRPQPLVIESKGEPGNKSSDQIKMERVQDKVNALMGTVKELMVKVYKEMGIGATIRKDLKNLSEPNDDKQQIATQSSNHSAKYLNPGEIEFAHPAEAGYGYSRLKKKRLRIISMIPERLVSNPIAALINFFAHQFMPIDKMEAKAIMPEEKAAPEKKEDEWDVWDLYEEMDEAQKTKMLDDIVAQENYFNDLKKAQEAQAEHQKTQNVPENERGGILVSYTAVEDVPNQVYSVTSGFLNGEIQLLSVTHKKKKEAKDEIARRTVEMINEYPETIQEIIYFLFEAITTAKTVEAVLHEAHKNGHVFLIEKISQALMHIAKRENISLQALFRNPPATEKLLQEYENILRENDLIQSSKIATQKAKSAEYIDSLAKIPAGRSFVIGKKPLRADDDEHKEEEKNYVPPKASSSSHAAVMKGLPPVRSKDKEQQSKVRDTVLGTGNEENKKPAEANAASNAPPKVKKKGLNPQAAAFVFENEKENEKPKKGISKK